MPRPQAQPLREPEAPSTLDARRYDQRRQRALRALMLATLRQQQREARPRR
jgi:hypothetical protein